MTHKIVGRQAKNRENVIRYLVSFGILLIVLSILQVSWLAEWKPMGAVPDLMMIAVLGAAYYCGKHAGAIVGISAGVLIEAMGSFGITILPVVYMVLGYVIGTYAKGHSLGREWMYLCYLLLCLPVRGAITLTYASLTYREIHLLSILKNAVLPEAVMTLVCGIVLWLPLRFLGRWLKKMARF